MSGDRELERRVRSAIARVEVPPAALGARSSRALSPAPLVVATLILAVAFGAQLVASSVAGPPASTPDVRLSPLPSLITRDQAVAFVRARRDQVGRIDRIDAKLVTYDEYVRVAGPIHGVQGDPYASPDVTSVTGFIGDPSQRYLWVVAVSGAVWPVGHDPIFWGLGPPVPSPTPYPAYRWAIFFIEAARADALTAPTAAAVAAGIAEDWPAAFDRLPSHAATAKLPSASATPALSTISTAMQAPEALSSVMRSLYAGGTPRIDRTEEKLMTAGELRPHGLSVPPALTDASPVWVVAMAGDLPSLKKSSSQPLHYRSALYLVDASSTNLQTDIAALWWYDTDTWPPLFDGLPDHPAVAVPYPSPTIAPSLRLGTRLGTIALGMTAADVRAALGTPTETTVSHGLGTPEWHYANGVWIFLRGSTNDPGVVWQIRVMAPFDRATAEGVRVGATESEARATYPAATSPDADQLQIRDGANTTVDVHFDGTRHVDWIVLNTEP